MPFRVIAPESHKEELALGAQQIVVPEPKLFFQVDIDRVYYSKLYAQN